MTNSTCYLARLAAALALYLVRQLYKIEETLHSSFVRAAAQVTTRSVQFC